MNNSNEKSANEPNAIDAAFLTNVRRMGLAEGISTLILFGIAMPLKYFAEIHLAVRIVGSIHGILFICLSLMLVMAVQRIPISKGLAFAGILAAIVPFGPFVYDRWLAAVEE